MMKEIIKKIKCKHEYEVVGQIMIDGGMGKIFIDECTKCGKQKRRVF